MSKLLKYLYSISLIFIINKCISQTDSTINKNSHFYATVSVGMPIYNKINLQQYNYSAYWVNSKPMPMYNFNFEYTYKHFNIGLSSSYIQNEYTGKDFEYDVLDYGSHALYQIKAKYNLYQKINYNLLQVGLTIGANINIKPKHTIAANLIISSNLFYHITVDNYFSENQLGYDTTNQKLYKHNPSNKNYGKVPNFSLVLIYNYNISQRILFDFRITSQYFYSNTIHEVNDPFNNIGHSEISFDTPYNVHQHLFIAPSIGLKFRLK